MKNGRMPIIVGGFLLSFVCGYVASQFSSTSLKGDLGGGKSALQECIDACYLSSVGGSSSQAPVYCCAVENDSCIAAPDGNPESDACDQNRTDYTTDSCDGNCGDQQSSQAPVYCCAVENDSCIAAPDGNPESDACDQNRTDYTTDSCDGNCGGGQSASRM